MLKRSLFVGCLVMLFGLSQSLTPSFAQQRTIRVAVLDFSMPQQNGDLHQFAPTLNQLLTNQLETSLGSSGMYQMVERKQIETLLNEHQLIRNGDISTRAKSFGIMNIENKGLTRS
ncbi:MAG: CsgG/HfaB family protein [Blastocatellia bacterium]